MTDDDAAATLEINDLHAPVEGKEILRGIDLVVRQGETHALMGPNGSGKSTLANVLWATPTTRSRRAASCFQGDDITAAPPTSGPSAGCSSAFQYPKEIPGVSRHQLPAPGHGGPQGHRPSACSSCAWRSWSGWSASAWTPRFADRYLNEGFSGGEKKRNEILQMAILEPEVAILDETDSGLDIDALRVVAQGIAEVRADRPDAGRRCSSPTTSACSTTSQPDRVHILARRPHRRRPAAPELAEQLERRGLRGVPGPRWRREPR